MPDDSADGRVQVKICGITNERDALAAIACGADALGFNLYPRSPRYLDVKLSSDWLTTLPSSICKIAVLVNPTMEEARATAGLAFFDRLQLHGDESSEFCQRLAQQGIEFAKAIPVGGNQVLGDFSDFHTRRVVLDSVSEGQFGGTGRIFPWRLARQFIDKHPHFRVMLAGGLNPANVARAVHEVRPFGVDVTTGVERSKGIKDQALMRAFIEAVRSPHS